VISLFVITNTSKWKKVHRYPVKVSESTELQKILNRVNKCLEAANISQEFTRVGYDIAARNDAKNFIKAWRTMVPQNFSNKYFSPCWETNFSVSIKGRLVESKVGNMTFLSKSGIYGISGNLNFLKSIGTFKSNVVCLPKVFLIGVAKCGTTFLQCLMTNGLGMLPVQLQKELHWWDRLPMSQQHRVVLQPENIPVHLLHFAKAYEMIAAGNYGVVTVDASPGIIDTHNIFYAKTKTSSNFCLLPAILPEVLPDSKFVITLRNPVTMMYSRFLFSLKGSKAHVGRIVPDIFHMKIITKLKQFEQCLQHSSLEWCAMNITYDIYSRELPGGRTRISLAMYYIHIHKWLSGASRERFLFLTMEEVINSTDAVGKKLWEFMGYPGEYKGVKANACKRKRNENHYNNYENDPQLKMRKDTEEILKNFFRPYNQMLAALLGDKKFLWEDT